MRRALIFGIPLVALGVASWAAWHLQRLQPVSSGEVVMMLPGPIPVLNPCTPGDESQRQLLDLLYQPLLRLDGQGRLAPAIAKSWAWRQHLTCWFASPEAAQAARQKLEQVAPQTRQAWLLEEAAVEDRSLVARFAKPAETGADQALQLLAEQAPLPLSFVRIETGEEGRPLLEEFSRQPAQAAGTVRLWFDDHGTCELVTTQPLLALREALAEWFFQKGRSVPRMTPFAEVAGLLEPVLDFKLDVHSSTWPDGKAVSAADVAATVEHSRKLGYPASSQESFRHIQAIVASGQDGIRVIYRRTYGAALASWVGLPILPESWIRKAGHSGAVPPPGTGEWQVSEANERRLVLRPKDSHAGSSLASLRVIPAAPELQAKVALATGTVDAVWPAAGSSLHQDPTLKFHPAPPRNRLLVLWNVRSSRLSELPVREALSHAVNREALAQDSPGAAARPGEILFAPGLWFSPGPSALPLNLSLARQKLEAGGWLQDVSGIAKKGGQALEFELLVVTGNPLREALAGQLAGQWREAGAQVTVKAVAPESLVPDHLEPGRFDAVLLGLDYELAWDQTAFWHSGQNQTRGGFNFSRLADPQLDLLLEALAGEFDTDRLSQRAQALQDRLMFLQPALPLIGDLQQIGLRNGKFPDLPAPDPSHPITLRQILRADAPDLLKMRLPNE